MSTRQLSYTNFLWKNISNLSGCSSSWGPVHISLQKHSHLHSLYYGNHFSSIWELDHTQEELLMASAAVIRIPDLIDLALGSNDPKNYNFQLLQTTLQAIVQLLNLRDVKVEFRGSDFDNIQNIISQADEQIAGQIDVSIKPLSTEEEMLSKSQEESKEMEFESLHSSDTGRKRKLTESFDDIIIVEDGKIVEPSKKKIRGIMPSAFSRLEGKVKTLQSQIEAISDQVLPSNEELLDMTRKEQDSKPISDLIHALNITKRMSGAEEGIDKLASLLESVAKEYADLRVILDKVQEEFGEDITEALHLIKLAADYAKKIRPREEFYGVDFSRSIKAMQGDKTKLIEPKELSKDYKIYYAKEDSRVQASQVTYGQRENSEEEPDENPEEEKTAETAEKLAASAAKTTASAEGVSEPMAGTGEELRRSSDQEPGSQGSPSRSKTSTERKQPEEVEGRGSEPAIRESEGEEATRRSEEEGARRTSEDTEVGGTEPVAEEGSNVRRSKETAVRGSEETTVRRSEETTVRRSEETAVRGSKEAAIRGSEETAIRGSEEMAVRRSHEMEVRGPEEETLGVSQRTRVEDSEAGTVGESQEGSTVEGSQGSRVEEPQASTPGRESQKQPMRDPRVPSAEDKSENSAFWKGASIGSEGMEGEKKAGETVRDVRREWPPCPVLEPFELDQEVDINKLNKLLQQNEFLKHNMEYLTAQTNTLADFVDIILPELLTGLPHLEEIKEKIKQIREKPVSDASLTQEDMEERRAKLNMEERLEDLEDKIIKYASRLRKHSAVMCETTENLLRRVGYLENTIGEVTKRVDLSQPENFMDDVQNIIQDLAEKVTYSERQGEVLRNTVNVLLEEREEKQMLIEKLAEEIHNLRAGKADRFEIDEALSEKADCNLLKLKVSHEQFDAACIDFAKGIDEALTRLEAQETVWTATMKDLLTLIGSKLDTAEVEPFKEEICKRIDELKEQVAFLAALKEGRLAAGAKSRYITDVNCISCDRVVSMRTEHDVPAIPAGYDLPPSKSLRPYISYQLDSIRKMKRKDPSRNVLTQEAKKKYNLQNMEDAADISDVPEFKNRYTGGSHTKIGPEKKVPHSGFDVNPNRPP